MDITQMLHHLQSLGLERLDAQLLTLHALGRAEHDRAWLLAHDTDVLPEAVMKALEALALRRLRGEPVAYLTGHKEFYGLNLAVDARVLVPRPDTETLVEWALEALAPSTAISVRAEPVEAQPLSVIDLGTGSGAIALALKHTRPALRVHAVDYSTDALAVAQANAQRLQLDVQFSQGSWLTGVGGCFHAIVSNPPYIAAQDPHLEALIHEPAQALASGSDGLDDIRTIIAQAPAHLLPGGWLLLEHGYDQAEAVRSLLAAAGFADVQSRRDLAGIERCSGGRLVT
ncbi:peptide chain release factor N(5)-glutamine methyltransferase [Rhodoferax saidenbachensis]|uniref:Release factor glutamine methyltransferase n=1 Tax=Rhodoferax saidenbachensis TaxID=1484693 RepID=A0A1P8KCX4_9BURK|nr:peptide chain release factor N(5)-glutamine methyltransferase [Rhodoferax saidenbachensis]APW43877.1 protein-(glutamine-N5) methyltransferase, release factor-specific [Rhodoferax saidenbachensis]